MNEGTYPIQKLFWQHKTSSRLDSSGDMTLGHEPTIQDVLQKLPDLHGVDSIVVDAPTRMARANRKAVNVLKRLKKKGFSIKPVAIFDTYGPIPTTPEELEKDKKWIYPGAAGIMQKVAKNQGLNVYPETLRCEVKGLKGPLADNALEKAVSFTRVFVSTFGKTWSNSSNSH